MKRRRFLGTLLLGGGLSAAFAGRAGAWLQPGATPDPLAVLAPSDSAAVVGRAYLAGHPHEADRARLVARLNQTLRRQDCDPAAAPADQMRAALSREIRADFAASRVVRVDGWILSETEARVCGLAALSSV